MVSVVLKDGQVRDFAGCTSAADIANSISKSLASRAVAAEVNGSVVDLNSNVDDGAKLSIVEWASSDGLEVIRHDAAHILADAVLQLYPNAKFAIGPAIEDGFYYDFDLEESISEDDLLTIENKMKEIARSKIPIVREVMSRDKAIELFRGMGQSYKVELIKDIDPNDSITVYRQGNFVDLCRGPHAPNVGFSIHVKLTKVAGAYWRGNSKNKMLQRIYGTAWASAADLEQYLHRVEEAKKRDHRKIGKELGWFHLQEEALGQVFWHEKGWSIYLTIERYIRRKLQENGYSEIKTPIIADSRLWERSGHWDKYHDNMFFSEAEDRAYAIKPMSCPCHVQVFNQSMKSYKDLPLRMAEFGFCHRKEPSGSLHGLMRVRGFVQDDAHIFCTIEQVSEEIIRFYNLLMDVYRDFGFHDVKVKFSDRPEMRAGDDKIWDAAESALKEALESNNIDYDLNVGEGAFYGPKLEFVLQDAIGRAWQCGTVQVDFVLPERLGASYIAADGSKQVPVMLHRAIIGTFERFIGILIEHYAGALPVWLAPVQVAICPVTNMFDDYCHDLTGKLKNADLRVCCDCSNEKISYKIRKYSAEKVPFICIVGEKEVSANTVSYRRLGSPDVNVVTVDEFARLVKGEVETLK